MMSRSKGFTPQPTPIKKRRVAPHSKYDYSLHPGYNFRDRLRDLRNATGCTYTELAKIAGIAPGTLKHVANVWASKPNYFPQRRTLTALCLLESIFHEELDAYRTDYERNHYLYRRGRGDWDTALHAKGALGWLAARTARWQQSYRNWLATEPGGRGATLLRERPEVIEGRSELEPYGEVEPGRSPEWSWYRGRETRCDCENAPVAAHEVT